jgi:tetratricopeptide (TPR) repeat protein
MKARIRILAPAAALLLHAGGAAASSLPERAADAAAAYDRGQYREAAQAYQAIAESDGVSAPLYYDLGAAQLADGQTGPAVLSFERAHWLAPADPGIAAALSTARSKAGLPAAQRAAWRTTRNALGPDAWAVAAALALVVACAGVSLWIVESERPLATSRARGALHALTAVAAAAFLVAALACVSLSTETTRAVALAADLTLRIAPFDAAESRGTLTPGESVRVEERHGDFVRVRAEGGRTGWVPERGIGPVVPG